MFAYLGLIEIDSILHLFLTRKKENMENTSIDIFSLEEEELEQCRAKLKSAEAKAAREDADYESDADIDDLFVPARQARSF